MFKTVLLTIVLATQISLTYKPNPNVEGDCDGCKYSMEC